MSEPPLRAPSTIWQEIKQFAFFFNNLWGLIGIFTSLFPLWTNFVSVFPLPPDFLRIASFTAVVLSMGTIVYEYIERDSLLGQTIKRKKVVRYNPQNALAIGFFSLLALVFLLNFVVYQRVSAAGSHYFILGIASPSDKPEFMMSDAEKKEHPIYHPLNEDVLEAYLNALPTEKLPEQIILIYGRLAVAISWVLLLFTYVIAFDCFTGTFTQLAVREYLKRQRLQGKDENV